MRKFIPRDYQIEAVNALWGAFAEYQKIDPLLCLPTGTGKASLLGMIIQDIYRNWPGTGKVIVLTHVKELVENDAKSIKWVWPQASVSIYSAGAGEKDLSGQVIVAGVQSFAAVAHTVRNPCVVLVDEAHMVPADDETLYRKVINTLRQTNPNMVVIGLTATPFRMKGGSLLNHGLFNHVAYDATQADRFVQFINDGYLIKLIPKATDTYLDTSTVAEVGGDFNQKQLQAAVDRDDLTYGCCMEMLQKGANRKKWLVFAAGVDHAEHVAKMLNTLGIPTGVIHSRMKGNRDEELAKFERGDYRALVNNGVLTTGYDCPAIDLLAILRPTKSNVLWIQILGRGTRPFFSPGFDIATRDGRLAAINASVKKDCLVLDFAGNTARLGPINEPFLPVKKKKGGPSECPMKVCEKCSSYNFARAAQCTECGHDFPPPSLKIAEGASENELIADTQPVIENIPVEFATYSIYQKPGKPDSIKVIYQSGFLLHSQWLCFEHTGGARGKAIDWWQKNVGVDSRPPGTCVEFLGRKNELRTPIGIRIWQKRGPRGGKGYPDILKVLYEEDRHELELETADAAASS